MAEQYKAVVGSLTVMTVTANTYQEAFTEIERQFAKKGRESAGEQWKRKGSVVMSDTEWALFSGVRVSLGILKSRQRQLNEDFQSILDCDDTNAVARHLRTEICEEAEQMAKRYENLIKTLKEWSSMER